MLSGNKHAFRSISWLCENGAALKDSGEMAALADSVIMAPPGGYVFLITQIAL